MAEKKQELEKRLQDVTGQLGTGKKATKKGKQLIMYILRQSCNEERLIRNLILISFPCSFVN